VLGLRHNTSVDFVAKYESNLEEMLLDHAHCEKKAAMCALNLIGRYPDFPDLVETMAEIVEEEMAHFREVLVLMADRGWVYRGSRASKYASKLHANVRSGYEDGFIDRMLVAAMIEARSCERFALLGEHLKDDTLRTFYQSLFESEARHYATYVKLAMAHFEEAAVRERLDEMLDIEAAIVAESDAAPKLHA
jgi:tRNA-(ms[2]io[6]A)-hydroxylase